MPRPLPHLTDHWDPGKTRLLHIKTVPHSSTGLSAVVMQLPHRQDAFFTDNRKHPNWHVINLPLPYLYYFIYINSYGKTNLQLQIAAIACSLTSKNVACQPLQVLPLPNTGAHGYTCSKPFYVSPPEDFLEKLFPSLPQPISAARQTLVHEVAKAAISHFWTEGFSYHEEVCAAHSHLYIWGGAGKYPKNESNISLAPYEKWSKLRLVDLTDKTWLKGNIDPVYTSVWMK